MANVGTLSANLILRTSDWSKGVSSAVVDARRLNQVAGRVFEATATDADRYGKALTKLKLMHAKGVIDTQAYGVAVAKLRREFIHIVPTVEKWTRAQRMSAAASGMATKAMTGMRAALKSTAMVYAGPIAAAYATLRTLGRAEAIEKGMATSLAITKRVGPQLKAEMLSIANDMARQTEFTTAEMAKGYYYLFSAGMDVAESMRALPAVAKFAQAGMFDLSKATDLLTDAQLALGMTAKDPEENLEKLVHVKLY